MSIDWGKTIKKGSITAAQAIVGALFALPLMSQILVIFAKFGVTFSPEQIFDFKAQAIILLGGAIAFLLELIRNWVKQKTKISWL